MYYIKEARLQAKLKSKEVANLLNITPATYSRYENGKIQPNPATLVELSKILNKSVDELLGKEDFNLYNNTLENKAAILTEKIISSQDDKKIKLTLETLDKISKMSSEQHEALNAFLSTIRI